VSVFRFVLFVCALWGLLLTAACDGLKDVVNNLDEFEANEIMVVLEAKGIEATKIPQEGRVVTYTVLVASSDYRDAMRILVANKLPRRRPTGLAEVYPAGGGGLIPTKSEEKAKFLMALQGEIERKLQRLPGVTSAHVTVVHPDKDIVRDLDTPPPPATASVAIVFNAYDDRGTSLISEADVQKLVAASVEDLKTQNVAVVMKKNEPAKLVDIFAESGVVGAPVTATAVLGIRVADEKAASKVKILVAVFLIVAVLALAVAAGAMVRSISMAKRALKAEAELNAARKVGRATQTGLSAAV
jgi:type III secretion protein J